MCRSNGMKVLHNLTKVNWLERSIYPLIEIQQYWAISSWFLPIQTWMLVYRVHTYTNMHTQERKSQFSNKPLRNIIVRILLSKQSLGERVLWGGGVAFCFLVGLFLFKQLFRIAYGSSKSFEVKITASFINSYTSASTYVLYCGVD